MPEAPSILEPKQEKPSKARIRRVAERVVGKRGEKPVTVTEAMRKEGYSEATIQNPKNITASKTWQEIMDELVPEENVGKLHKELMEAGSLSELTFELEWTDDEIKKAIALIPGAKLVRIGTRKYKNPKDASQKDEDGNPLPYEKYATFLAPTLEYRDRALDKAYKLRGAYAAEKHHNTNLNFSLAELRKMRDAGEI